AQKFSGNMLTRPGLLLNPWEKRSTDQQTAQMTMGQAPTATPGGAAASSVSGLEMAPAAKPAEAPNTTGANLDFLANAAPVLYNLVPDKDGIVRIERKALGDRQHIQIYAEDLTSA